VAYRARPLSPERLAGDLEQRSLADSSLHDYLDKNLARPVQAWPLPEWDLATLTLAAFYYSPDLDVARAQWAVARAGVVTAGARPNPTFAFTPEYVTHTDQPSPWILGFSFDIPIETFGKRGYRVERARRLAEAARLEIASVAWGVRSRLRAAMLDWWAADRRGEIARRELALRENLVQALERRLEVGEVSALDLGRERVARDQVRLLTRSEERRGREARARVAAAIGIPESALEESSVSVSLADFQTVPSLGEPSTPEIRREALLSRADIGKSLAEYAAAESALRLEIARQYPDIHLGPGYTWNQGENHFVFGFSAELPIFNRHRGPIAEAEARRKEAEARFVALQARVLGDAGRALALFGAAHAEVDTADALVTEGKANLERVSSGFRAGELDRVALRTAELELTTSGRSRLDAIFEAQKAVGLLEDVVQRPLAGGPHPAPPESSARLEKEIP
jgi:outer membrane protein TolC